MSLYFLSYSIKIYNAPTKVQRVYGSRLNESANNPRLLV